MIIFEQLEGILAGPFRTFCLMSSLANYVKSDPLLTCLRIYQIHFIGRMHQYIMSFQM